jgi:hypothetical protein
METGYLIEGFVDFFSPSRQITGQYLKLGLNTLPDPL